MTTPTVPERDVLTADDPSVRACTAGGVEHDYRPFDTRLNNRPHTYMRCVWCHGVRCGNYGEHQPCIEPYHHRVDHRLADGRTWPKGGNKP